MKRLICCLLLAAAGLHAADEFRGGPALDKAINQAIEEGRLPGAVLLVGQPGKILYRKAYGLRAIEPQREPMTVDTIFDIASLTKIVSTTASVMRLYEQGKIRMNDPVTKYLPQFQGGHSDITVRQLLSHFSGLRPDVDLKATWSGYDTGIKLALTEPPMAQPGERFIYSDINFLLLGEIVRVLSGEALDQFAAKEVFAPLKMMETRYQPPAAWRSRIAPTERVEGTILRGVVHDPTARRMGGVAGHAGIFSTADDLSHFCEMMINGGIYDGKRWASALAVQKFTEPQTPPNQPILRGFGFDLDSPFSSNRGELFPIGSFGHTGFTGTSIWIDPVTKTYVILLANSVHPTQRPAMTPLRAQVATIVAASLDVTEQKVALTSYLETAQATPLRRVVARNAEVMNGIDVAAADGFKVFRGKRVGLITNQTGITRDGKRNIDVMLAAGVKLVKLFSPEHGIAGKLDQEDVGDQRDPISKLPVVSLYRQVDRKPSAAALRDIDVMVFDIQDVGVRFYTYISTMKNAMEAAAEHHIEFVVLDRPNPITGLHVEGPMLDRDLISFVGCSVLPLRHGMTIGELAGWINTEDRIGAKLSVVKLKNWKRGDWWDSTALPWVDPSPNMRSLGEATLYPGVGMIESSKNYSVGRGTDKPFEQIGADWIDGPQLAHYLNQRMVPGVRFYPVRFRPTSSNFQGKEISGVRMELLDREGFSGLRLGLEIAAALQKLYPGKIDFELNQKLIGSRILIDGLKNGTDPRALEFLVEEPVSEFRKKSKNYLLY